MPLRGHFGDARMIRKCFDSSSVRRVFSLIPGFFFRKKHGSKLSSPFSDLSVLEKLHSSFRLGEGSHKFFLLIYCFLYRLPFSHIHSVLILLMVYLLFFSLILVSSNFGCIVLAIGATLS